MKIVQKKLNSIHCDSFSKLTEDCTKKSELSQFSSHLQLIFILSECSEMISSGNRIGPSLIKYQHIEYQNRNRMQHVYL